MKVLFVCTGNTCRSVMAHYPAQGIIRRKGLKNWEVKSCGTAGDPSYPVPPIVRELVKEQGGGDFEHTSTPIDSNLADWADIILTMTHMHKESVSATFPQARGKVHVLREYAGLKEPDIEDPIGRPDEVYRRVLKRILEAVTLLFERSKKADVRKS